MAMKNLTEKMVDRIPYTSAAPAQIVISDRGMPNLLLKVGKKTKTFYWDGMTTSGRRMFKLGIFPAISLESARDECRKTSEAIRKGLDPNGTDIERMTGKDLFNECIDSVQFRDRSEMTVETQESYLRRGFLPVCGNKLIKDIHCGHVMDMINVYLRAEKRGAAGHMRDSLAILFKYAIQRRYINLNPMSGITPPKPGKPRDRVLSDEELKTVWFALDHTKRQPQQHAIAIRLLMLLPFRGIELIGARWSEIDFANANWLVPPARIKTRSSNPRAFLMPLPPLALKLLRELHGLTGRGKCLFPAPKSEDRPIETKIIERFISRNLTKGIFEDMERWTKHDLRRTIATNMGKLKVDELIVARSLNHSIRGITARVYNLYRYREEKLEALNAWENHLSKILDLATFC